MFLITCFNAVLVIFFGLSFTCLFLGSIDQCDGKGHEASDHPMVKFTAGCAGGTLAAWLFTLLCYYVLSSWPAAVDAGILGYIVGAVCVAFLTLVIPNDNPEDRSVT